MNVAAIILAAGSGSRMGGDITKQRIAVLGKSVLKRSVEAFQNCDDISEIIVVARSDELDFAKDEVKECSKATIVVSGGRTRAESASLGFACVGERADFVAIHDAARCLITSRDISRVVADAMVHGAATASYKATDTIKEIDECGCACNTPDRSRLVHVLTPQVFSRNIYERAVTGADLLDPMNTDDNKLAENIGVYPYCTETRRDNVKITYKEDVAYAEFILKERNND